MKIICIGRNYAEHAKELNNNIPTEPIIFLKPKTALIVDGKALYYPEFTNDLQYECELVVRMSKNGKYIQEKFARKYYNAMSLGIDFTARDIQRKQKELGLPWEIAKSFDNSAAIGKFISKSEVDDIQNINFHLDINQNRVQQGNTKDMIYSVDRIISYISRFFTLKIGDLIFTGTPAGIGPVSINDHLQGYIEERKLLDFRVK